MHLVMANLNLGQDGANKKKQSAAHIVARSYPLYQAVPLRRRRFGSLIDINPSSLG